MTAPDDGKNGAQPRSLWRMIAGIHLPLERETAHFILASALDTVMTLIVMHHSAEGFTTKIIYESNPVARFFFDHWGSEGFVYFKFSLVAFVAVIAQVIATKKVRTARWVLNFGTIVVLCVVIYTLFLFVPVVRFA